jgi:hypothetical protein
MLETSFVDIVHKIVGEQGKDVFLETGKLRSLLLDYTRNEFKKESSLLLTMLDADCVKYINMAGNLAECKQALVKRLEEDDNLSPQKTAEMLDLLFHVLRGVKMQDIYLDNSTKEFVNRDNMKKKKPHSDQISRNRQSDGTVKTYNIYNYGGTVVINQDRNMEVKGNNITNTIKSSDAIADSSINLNLPNIIDEEQFSQILGMLEKYIESKQADKMTDKDKHTFHVVIDEVRKQGPKTGGWEKLCKFISTFTHLSVFANNLSTFLTAHPEIPEAIRLMFMR